MLTEGPQKSPDLILEQRKQRFREFYEVAKNGKVFLEPHKVLEHAANLDFLSQQADNNAHTYDWLRLEDVGYVLEEPSDPLSRVEYSLLVEIEKYGRSLRSEKSDKGTEQDETSALLDKISSYLMEEVRTWKRNSKAVTENSQSAIIRRSALLLYKTLCIPGQELNTSGGFKDVIGPHGVGDNHLPEEVQQALPKSALTWDGNFIKTDARGERAPSIQSVRISDKLRRGEINGPHILVESDTSNEVVSETDIIQREVDVLEHISEELSSPHIPRLVRSQGNISRHIEYIPHPYSKDDTIEIAHDIAKITTLVKEVSTGLGILNLDIKPSNTRLRDDGEVVVIDWGSTFTIEQGAKSISVSKLLLEGGVSPGYVPPECDGIYLAEGSDGLVDIDSAVVFQGGANLVANIFSEDQVFETFSTSEAGYLWELSQGSGYKIMSITDETFLNLWAAHPQKALPKKLAELILLSVQVDPRLRPEVGEFIDELLAIQDSDLITYEQFISRAGG